MMRVAGQHTHNSGLKGKKDYAFMDASLTFRTARKNEIVLSADNIFNTRTFISRDNSDLIEYYTIYHLRPRSIMISTHIYIGKK